MLASRQFSCHLVVVSVVVLFSSSSVLSELRLCPDGTKPNETFLDINETSYNPVTVNYNALPKKGCELGWTFPRGFLLIFTLTSSEPINTMKLSTANGRSMKFDGVRNVPRLALAAPLVSLFISSDTPNNVNITISCKLEKVISTSRVIQNVDAIDSTFLNFGNRTDAYYVMKGPGPIRLSMLSLTATEEDPLLLAGLIVYDGGNHNGSFLCSAFDIIVNKFVCVSQSSAVTLYDGSGSAEMRDGLLLLFTLNSNLATLEDFKFMPPLNSTNVDVHLTSADLTQIDMNRCVAYSMLIASHGIINFEMEGVGDVHVYVEGVPSYSAEGKYRLFLFNQDNYHEWKNLPLPRNRLITFVLPPNSTVTVHFSTDADLLSSPLVPPVQGIFVSDNYPLLSPDSFAFRRVLNIRDSYGRVVYEEFTHYLVSFDQDPERGAALTLSYDVDRADRYTSDHMDLTASPRLASQVNITYTAKASRKRTGVLLRFAISGSDVTGSSVSLLLLLLCMEKLLQ